MKALAQILHSLVKQIFRQEENFPTIIRQPKIYGKGQLPPPPATMPLRRSIKSVADVRFLKRGVTLTLVNPRLMGYP